MPAYHETREPPHCPTCNCGMPPCKGDSPDWRWKYLDRQQVISQWHKKAVELGYDGVADLLTCVEQGEPPIHVAKVMARAAGWNGK